MYDWQTGGFGLYLHWPFCQSKCPYCDFNSHVSQQIDQKRWAAAYIAEIARLGAETKGRVLQTVFFGGGTPSLMEPELVDAILEKVRATWPMVNDPEITLEANPGSVEAGRFAAYRQSGVNRISMGLQALNDVDLRRLGRLHTVAEALKAYETARATFDRVSFDLIYARQDQTLADWKSELLLATSLAVDHLSLYQLTIEDGTVFAARHAKGGLPGLPEEDLAADMYNLTQDVCEAAGLAAYEVSNHAKPGLESRHNLIYWRGGDYVGIGPGAHGRLTRLEGRLATEAPKNPDRWLKMVESQRIGEKERQLLDPRDIATEYLMMSVRLTEGMSLTRYEHIGGMELSRQTITRLSDLKMIEIQSGYLKATKSGRLLLNAIIRELIA